MEQSLERLLVLERIKEYEKKGYFDRDVENDPPTTPLKPGQVDYTLKKLSSKISSEIANRVAKKYFDKLIKQGQTVVIFPQGHRHKKVHPSETAIHHGVGMIEYRSQAAVLPVFIKTKNYRMRLFGRKDVYIGQAISFEEFNFEGGNTAEYKRTAQVIFDRIISLEPKEENK